MNAPFNSVTTRDPFMAFLCDDETLDTVRPVVEELGWQPEKCFAGGLRNAIQSLSVTASPSVLLVDLSEAGDPLGDINSLAEVCEPGTIVIAIGQINDVRLYRDLVLSGLQDYLLKPVSPDALRDAFTHALTALNGPRGDEEALAQSHLSTAVIGTRGGVGASLIASSLSWTLSAGKKLQTAMLDLDVHFGTGALNVDLEPGRGLIDAIENPSRIDGLFLERAMLKANERLSIMSSEASIGAPVMSDGSAFFQLQEEFRSAFEVSVLDLPRNMLIHYPNLLSEAHVIVLVCDMTLASARDTIRLLSWLKNNAKHCRILVVANKVGSNSTEISQKDFESSIEQRIDLIIPEDAKSAAQAAKLGQPIVEAVSGSKASAAIRQLADMVVEDRRSDDDAETETKSSRSLSGLMSKFKNSGAK